MRSAGLRYEVKHALRRGRPDAWHELHQCEACNSVTRVFDDRDSCIGRMGAVGSAAGIAGRNFPLAELFNQIMKSITRREDLL